LGSGSVTLIGSAPATAGKATNAAAAINAQNTKPLRALEATPDLL